MEALAKHDFVTTQKDELSFKKGDIVKIMTTDYENQWHTAEINGCTGLVPANYLTMKPQEWWFQRCRQVETEKFLLSKTHDGNQFIHLDGAFLIRESEATRPGDFLLSVKISDHQVEHFKVLRDGAGKYFLWVVKFNSLNQLVEYHKTSSVSRSKQIYLRKMHQVKAKYDFTSNDSEDLNFTKGTYIVVLEHCDANWWKGKLANGVNMGLFPATYVEELSSD